MAIELHGATAVQQAFTAARRETLARWQRTLSRHAFRAVRTVQAEHRSGSKTTATATRVGTGNLRASYSQRTGAIAHGVESRIGLMRLGARGRALSYGATHEEGAVIHGKPWLAIPLPSIRRPSGLAPPTSEFRADSFVYKSRRGNLLIARRRADKSIENLYVLRRSVSVPARPLGGAINAAVAAVQGELQRDLEHDIVAAIGGTR